jgi:predicted PurR-regulated permease PerM
MNEIGDIAPVTDTGPGLRMSRPVAVSIHVCAFVLGTGALYLGRDVALPMVLGTLFALTLMPVVRRLYRRGIPPGVTATGLVILLAGVLFTTIWLSSGPVAQWVAEAPSIGRQVEAKLRALRGSVEMLEDVGKKVDEISGTGPDENAREVVVREPGFLAGATSSLWSATTTIGLTLLFMLFLLANGDAVNERIIRVLPRLSDKKAALRIVHDIEDSISHYLLTITLVNVGLGVAIGIAMWMLGMPNPALWGVAATVLNFLPYIGAVLGLVMTTLVALVTFPDLGSAVLVPVTYLVITSLEGQVITPVIIGRRLELNTVAVFVGVMFWGWVWGLAGVLIAVPLLVAIKRVCDHLPSWAAFGEFLSAGGRRTAGDAEPNA